MFSGGRDGEKKSRPPAHQCIDQRKRAEKVATCQTSESIYPFHKIDFNSFLSGFWMQGRQPTILPRRGLLARRLNPQLPDCLHTSVEALLLLYLPPSLKAPTALQSRVTRHFSRDCNYHSITSAT